MCKPNVSCRVLWHTGRPIPWTKANDGRAITEKVEETEGRCIDPPLKVHCGSECDGAGRDKTRKDHVSVFAIRASEIEFHEESIVEKNRRAPDLKRGDEASDSRQSVTNHDQHGIALAANLEDDGRLFALHRSFGFIKT